MQNRPCPTAIIGLLPALLAAQATFAAEAPTPPQASISNGVIQAKLYLPDAAAGYYRGTRFDWSGVFASLTYAGHNYFGPWFEHYDPKIHDAISGPVEEFLSGASAIGYDEAKPGGTFIRIGVGVLRKPVEEKFDRFKTYEIASNGKWKVEPKADRVTFHQQAADPTSGYAYSYTKTARLELGKPVLILEHSLKNTGSKPLSTEVYDHNFLVIDGTPTGPGFTLTFPFTPAATGELNDFVETKGHSLVYIKDLGPKDQKDQYVMVQLKGYGPSSSDNDIRVENQKTGAGVHITGSQPLFKLLFWSVSTVLAPEPYLHFDIQPGQTAKYEIRYEFYTTNPGKM
jgi:hypothetical protein